jgi:anti-sigma B factor antagonist
MGEGSVVDEIEFSVASLQTGADAVTVKIAGELDLYTAPDVRDELAALPAEARRVAVDLTELTFVDSAGIAALLVAARRLRARGGVMTLVVEDPRVLRVLEVSGLDRYFAIRRQRLVAVD